MKLIATMMAVCLILLAYTHNEPSPTATTMLEFLPQSHLSNRIPWLENVAAGSGFVELDPWGLYAINEKTLFLFGGLDAEIYSFRSLLLRSDDAGDTWREIMLPEPGSDIVSLAFTENGYGWALMLWTIETPGSGRLYRTIDFGNSWQKVADVPTLDNLSYPTSIHMINEWNGEIRINVNDVSCKIITTIDGGYSWRESGLSLPINKCSFQNANTTVGFDGTEWQLEPTQQDNGIVKINKMETDGSWVLINQLPEAIPYSMIQSGSVYKP